LDAPTNEWFKNCQSLRVAISAFSTNESLQPSYIPTVGAAACLLGAVLLVTLIHRIVA
jgi:hypothetical protein